MKRLRFAYLNDIRIPIIWVFTIFFLLDSWIRPDGCYWLNSKPVIQFGDFTLGQLYVNGGLYYPCLGIWIILPFIYCLYKKKWKDVGMLLAAFCIPMFIRGTSISYDLVDYKMNIGKHLEPRSKKDKLGWLLLDSDKQVIPGIYSLYPIHFNHNRAIVEINNNWTTSISGNDVTIIPDTNRHTYKGISYVYIDTLGKLVYPRKFQEIKPFYEHGFIICKDTFYGVIDTRGKEILPFEHDDISTEDLDGVYGYHLLKKNMQYGLFCDSTLSILLSDCSCIEFWMRDMDSCIFTKNGKDSLLVLSTRTKTPFEWHKHELQFEWNIELIDTITFSLKHNVNTIREIIINQQDTLPKFQIISDYLYYDHWGDSYMNISNHWRDQFSQDSNNFLSVDFQIENKLYNEWWKFHEHTFSTIHKLQNSDNCYDIIEKLNLQKILRLIYSYLLLFNEETNLDVTSTINKQVEFSNWNDSIIACYNDLVQVQGFSPIAIRHINNEISAWKQLIDHKINLLNEVRNGKYPSRLKQLLNDELKDFLLIQLKQMKLLYSDILYYMNNHQTDQNNWIANTWKQYPLNIEIDSLHVKIR